MSIRSGSVVELIDTDGLSHDKYHVGMRGIAYRVKDALPIPGTIKDDYVLVFFVSDHARRAKQLRAMEYDAAAHFHIKAYNKSEQALIVEDCLIVVGIGKMPSRRGRRHRYKERALKFEEA